METGTTCFDLCKKLNIGKWTWCKDTHELHFEFSTEDLNQLKALNLVAKGAQGGLVLGNSHTDGGIHLIYPITKKKYRYLGEMEGWEYLSSSLIKQELAHDFLSINEETHIQGRDIKTDFEIPKICNIIDVTGIKVPFILILDQHFIINRFATEKRINELIALDIKNNS